MNKFIIASHSTFAQGIYECLKFFKNDIDNVKFINAYVENNEFEKEFVKTLEEFGSDNLIVLTDLPGGSVNVVCANLMNEYKYKLISGVNFPLVLELLFQFEDLNDDDIETIIENAKKQIVFVNKDLITVEETEDDDL